MFRQKFYANSVSIAKETDKIKELAEKVGIVLPSIHTALFQSRFAPIDDANLNGVRLANEVVDEEIKKMIGAQANMEHMGYGWIVGIILDAWVNDTNEIEIIYSFAKNIYEDEYVSALEALENGELAVSFELLAETSAQEKLDDGTILLHDYNFTGVGVLIDNPPAYPNAKTYEYAKAIKNRVNEVESKKLVFASQITEVCDKILSEESEEDKPKNLSLVTSSFNNHFHISDVDWNGNGQSISIMGSNNANHIHEVINWEIQDSNDHGHKISDEVIAKVKNHVKLTADKWTSDIYNNFPDSSFAVIEPAFLDGITGNRQARHLAFKDRNGRVDSTNYSIALDKVDEILPITDSITTEELRKQAKEELDKHKDILTNPIEGKQKQGGNTNVTDEQKTKIEEIRAELGDLVKDISDEDLLNDTVVAEIRKEKEEASASEVEAKAEEKEEAKAKTKEQSEAKEEADKAKTKAEAEAKEKELAFKRDVVEIRTYSVEDVDGIETTVENVQTISVTDWNAMQEAKAKVDELEASIETIKADAVTIAKAKVSLEGNEYAKDFTDEDYLSEEKVTKAVQDQKDAETIATLKEELKDNEYAKDFSDEDYLNKDKVELAKTKAKNDELKAKLPAEEINASENQEEESPMDTGNVGSEAEDHKKILASIQKDNTENRNTQTVYERK